MMKAGLITLMLLGLIAWAANFLLNFFPDNQHLIFAFSFSLIGIAVITVGSFVLGAVFVVLGALSSPSVSEFEK